MPTAQDHALLALLAARGAGEALERARALLARGEPQPLAQALLASRALPPATVAELVRDLARTGFGCARCGEVRPYDALAALPALRCPRCGDPLTPRRPRDTRLFHSLDRLAPEATVPAGPPRAAAASAASAPGVPLPPVSAASAPGVPLPPVSAASAGEAPSALVRPSARSTAEGTRTVGPYQLVRELGRGSNGVVYLAKKPGLERRFAVKVLLDAVDGDPEAVARFQQEAALASKIEDPGVIAVYDVGLEAGLHYYAMEFCAGETLDARLRRGPLPPLEAAEVVARLARTVEAAHARGVIHRDLKPANVIIEEGTGRPRILDFGMARDRSRALTLTKTGDILGTPYYMAPEQIAGAADIDHRIDVYALGVILYQCLTGRRPFEAANVPELARKIRAEDPLPPRRLAPDVPEALERACLRAMARRREARFARAGELSDALAAVVAQLATTGSGTTSAGRAQGSGGASSERGARGAPAGAVVAAVAGALAVASVVVAGVFASGRLGAATPPPGPTTAAPTPDAPSTSTSTSTPAPPAPAPDPAAADAALRRARTLAQRRAELSVVDRALEEAAAAATGDAARSEAVSLERARLHARRGRPEEALALADGLGGLTDATAHEAARARAWALERLGRDAEARAAWRALSERAGGAPPGHVARAALARLAQDAAAAALSARRALEGDPGSAPAGVELTLALLQQATDPLADPVRRAALRDQARVAAEEAVTAEPDDPRALLALARALTSPRREGAGDAALAALDEAVALAEPAPDPAALVLRATLARAGRRLAPALSDLDRALALRPDDPDALLQRGAARHALADAGDPAAAALRDQARGDWRRAWSRDRDRVLRALVLEGALLDPSTRIALRQAVGLGTFDPATRLHEVTPALRGRIEGWLRGVDDEAARAALLAGLVGAAEGRPWDDLAPSFAEATLAAPRSPVVATLHARALAGRDRYEAALAELARARALQGPLSTLDRLEGEVLWFRGDGPAAVKVWDPLAARAAERADGRCAAAWAALARDRDDDAVAATDAALELEPLHAPALLVRSLALRNLDRYDEALAALDRALEAEGALLGRVPMARAALALEQALDSRAPSPDAARRIDAGVEALERVFPITGATSRLFGIQTALRLGPGWTGWPRARIWLDDAARLEPRRAELDVYDGVLRLVERAPAEEILACWRRGREKQAPGHLVVPAAYLDAFRRLHGDRPELKEFEKR